MGSAAATGTKDSGGDLDQWACRRVWAFGQSLIFHWHRRELGGRYKLGKWVGSSACCCTKFNPLLPLPPSLPPQNSQLLRPPYLLGCSLDGPLVGTQRLNLGQWLQNMGGFCKVITGRRMPLSQNKIGLLKQNQKKSWGILKTNQFIVT